MTKQERKDRLEKAKFYVLGTIALLTVVYLLNLTFGVYIGQFFLALNSILVPISASIFIVYLIQPLNEWFINITKKKRLSAILSIIVFILLGIVFIGFLYLVVMDQLSQIFNMIESNWTSIIERVEYLIQFIPEDIRQQISNPNTNIIEFGRTMTYLSSQIDFTAVINEVFKRTIDAAAILFNLSIILPLTPIFMYFFLVDGDKIFNFIISYIPKKLFREEIEKVAVIANESTGKYMRGKIISIGFLILFFFIGFALTFIVFGKISLLDAIIYGLIFAVIMGILDLIPFIGPFIGFLFPIFFVLLLSSGILEFLLFFGFLLVINTLGQNLQKTLIEPLIMSKEVDLHPLAVLMGILFFGALFGFVGFLLSTPIVATIHSTRNYFLNKREIEESFEKQQQLIINENTEMK
jgi:putative permease